MPKKLYYWVLDYTYVLFWLVYDLVSRDNPINYRHDQPSNLPPVIVIPGIYETWKFLRPVNKSLFRAGYDIYFIEGLGINAKSIRQSAEAVNVFIEKYDLHDAVIVAHSKGGLIGKYFLSFINENKRAKQMVAISTPFSGSIYAKYFPLKAVREFSPRSEVIVRLQNHTEVNDSIISVYPEFDPHIPKGSNLKGAKNIQINTMGHFRSLADPELQTAVLTNIKS